MLAPWRDTRQLTSNDHKKIKNVYKVQKYDGILLIPSSGNVYFVIYLVGVLRKKIFHLYDGGKLCSVRKTLDYPQVAAAPSIPRGRQLELDFSSR